MRKPCTSPSGHSMMAVVPAEKSPCGFCPVLACERCGCERTECECPAFAIVRRVELDRFPLQALEVPAGAEILGVHETQRGRPSEGGRAPAAGLKGRPFLVYQHPGDEGSRRLTLRMVAESALPDPRRHRFLGLIADEQGLPAAVYYDAVAWERVNRTPDVAPVKKG